MNEAEASSGVEPGSAGRSRHWCAWAIIASLMLTASAFILFKCRRPLLIAYHENAMTSSWQREVGIQPPGRIRELLGSYGVALPPPKRRSDIHVVLRHREALVRLGYLKRHSFAIPPIKVGGKEYFSLTTRLAEATGHQPTAQVEYDLPTTPTRVVGVTVYARDEEMARWQKFFANMGKSP